MMSKQLYALDTPNGELPESCLDLDDDVLDPIYELAAAHSSPTAWRLFGDLYADAEFSPEDAAMLAAECEQLAAVAASSVAVWLWTIGTFAREASAWDKCLRAVAD